jgi:hypothetical protein
VLAQTNSTSLELRKIMPFAHDLALLGLLLVMADFEM